MPFAEGDITHVRREVKLLLPHDEAARLSEALAREAAPVESRIVAVYFDSAAARLAERSQRSPADCVKVRAKAYAPDRSGAPGRVVLEVKRERGGLTTKERLWLAPADVRGTLERSLAPSFGRLAPAIATSYRRRVFQASAEWRVSLDDELRFHPASWEVVAAAPCDWGAALAPAFGVEPRVVVELKHGPGGLPGWLAAIGRARGSRYSKFAAATNQAALCSAGA